MEAPRTPNRGSAAASAASAASPLLPLPSAQAGARPAAAEPAAEAAEQAPRLRRQRRQFFRDRRFQSPRIEGLKSREFEVDLLPGEHVQAGPIRVQLTKTVSFCRRLALALLSCGLSEVWQLCCAGGSHVFEVDARLALTTHGRLLLWTHAATGGGRPLHQHCLRAARHPLAVALLALLVVFTAFGPTALGLDLLSVAGAMAGLLGLLFATVLWEWLWERASLTARTSVRQFEARDLSCVRLLCSSYRSLWGLGGEIVTCNVHMFFGAYPRDWELQKTLPRDAFDSGSVRPLLVNFKGQAGLSSLDASKIQTAAGQANSSSTHGFTSIASALLILLAFAAFLNELSDFFLQWAGCVSQHGHQSPTAVSQCISSRFRVWWTGIEDKGGWQTVVSHWIDVTDWSLQLMLFLWVVGPATLLLLNTLADQSSAGLGFIVDRRRGTSTEDERFDEHWQELTAFVVELSRRASAAATGALPRSAAAHAQDDSSPWWEEVPGDTPCSLHAAREGGDRAGAPENGMPPLEGDSAEPPPCASWAQVEEMTAGLIDPLTGRVRVYRGVLSCATDERVLAVYPERVVMPLVARVKVLLTCGLEYWLHWRRRRLDGAIVLTDRRLIQVSALSTRARRSLKLDMFTVGASVKYMALTPPVRKLCAAPTGRIAVSTHCGTLELRLARMPRRRECALEIWLGLSSLQDTPSISSVELGEWITVMEDRQDEEEDASAEASVQLAQRESAALWGPASRATSAASAAAAAAAVAGASSGSAGVADLEVGPGSQTVGEQGGGMLALGDSRARAEQWGLVLAAGERVLWGPCLFDEEVSVGLCCQARRSIRRRPSAAVTITDRRLVILQFHSWGTLHCRGLCHRTLLTSLAVVPLRWVLGFCIEESFAVQQAALARMLGRCCCRSNSTSELTVRVLTNAGLGKIYLSTLSARQRVLPRAVDPPCNFEEEKVLELRRWLGNVALFFGSEEAGRSPDGSRRRSETVELWRCARGWAP